MEAAQVWDVFNDLEFAQAVDAEMPEGDGPVDDRLRVDYLLEKVAEARAEYDEVVEFTARRIQMIQDHGERESLRINGRIRWLEGRIRAHLPHTGEGMQSAFGKKSLALPHGTVGYRSTGESIAVLDPAKALLWAKANGLPITTKESIGKKPLHEYVTSTGDAPDPELCGFAVEPSQETFYAKPRGES